MYDPHRVGISDSITGVSMDELTASESSGVPTLVDRNKELVGESRTGYCCRVFCSTTQRMLGDGNREGKFPNRADNKVYQNNLHQNWTQ
jgi:hypothetical protein